MALSYDVCVYIHHPAISFSDRLGQSLQRPCGDRTETAHSSCSHRIIFTNSAFKNRMISVRYPCGIPTVITRAYDQCLAQMTIQKRAFFMISVRCLYGDRAIYMRCVYGLHVRACDFSKFVIVRSKTKS